MNAPPILPGYRKPRRWPARLATWFFWCALFGVFVFFLWEIEPYFRSDPPTEAELLERQEQKNKNRSKQDEFVLASRLWGWAKDAVTERLKAPATAKFPSLGWDKEAQVRVSSANSNLFFVNGYVDAQNTYGAMIRSKWIVELERQTNQWVLRSVNIQE